MDRHKRKRTIRDHEGGKGDMKKWSEVRIVVSKKEVERLEDSNKRLEKEYNDLVWQTRKTVERMAENNVIRRRYLDGIYDNTKLLRINEEWVEEKL
ncbi:hypothetical protein ELS81_09725 [Bacillus sp. VKPM B-3276]|nr:hypothetical protein proCM3_gp25 [Bacillus phage proCM3]MRA95329.1 hypothetical protein [Bacillus thuringiensis]RNG53035.1 hypothetical protein EEL55_09660 [Bacillus thuringiensis]RUR63663.1 hypothetical protein ELS81_09725 [Bacillus sp. VKPM B-3276]